MLTWFFDYAVIVIAGILVMQLSTYLLWQLQTRLYRRQSAIASRVLEPQANARRKYLLVQALLIAVVIGSGLVLGGGYFQFFTGGYFVAQLVLLMMSVYGVSLL